VGNTARNVGRTYALEGRDAEALPYLDRALAIQDASENSQFRAAPDFLRSQRSVVLARLGQHHRALTEAEEAVMAPRGWADRGNKRYLGESLVNLGLVWLELGDQAGAAGAFGEAVMLLEEQYGLDHPKVSEARCGYSLAAGESLSQRSDVCEPLAAWGLADPVLRKVSDSSP